MRLTAKERNDRQWNKLLDRVRRKRDRFYRIRRTAVGDPASVAEMHIESCNWFLDQIKTVRD